MGTVKKEKPDTAISDFNAKMTHFGCAISSILALLS